MGTEEAPFSHLIVFLPVDDLERSTVFYRDRLRLRLVVDQGTCRIFGIGADSFVGVCERPGEAQPSPGVILTLVCEDVDGWVARLQMNGVDIERLPQASPEYGIYHAFVRDPDGHLVEIQRFDDPGWAWS